MRLTKLEIYGFKSFAKRTEIVFPQNITGIVGPNGSGKSNIGDAVRWVLGEQNARILRGNNMSDVIFIGTETRKPLNYCEVALTFDNSDHQLPVAYEETRVTRRVYRSGESEYLLNGTSCRLKDIVDLFRDTGIGKEGYSIIGQGRIDEILSQRGEDRRAVFEEAAGISRFRSRKEEAEGRLKKADENLVRVEDLLKELSDRLSPLKEQAETAKEYLSLSDSLRELDVRLYLLRIERLQKRISAVEDSMLQISDSVRQADAALAEAVQQRDLATEAQEKIQQTLNEAHISLLQKSNRLHEASEAVKLLVSKIENNEQNQARLAKETETVRSRLNLIVSTIHQSDGGYSEAQALLSRSEGALEERKAAFAAVSETTQRLEEDLSGLKTELIERMNQIQTVRASQARQSAMKQQMIARLKEVQSEIQDEKKKEDGLQEALETAGLNLSGEEKRLGELKQGYEASEQKTGALLQKILEAQKQIHDHLQHSKAIDTRYKTLKELQEGYEGYQYSVKNALSYAKHNAMKGVYDVVAKLIMVPQKYEVAFDMALGQSMQNIVTSTEQEAKALIDYLRKNHLGRATFLPLSSVKSHTLDAKEREVLTMPGCLGVASELCSFDECYRSVIENLLGRTVVARDLDSGIQIMHSANHSFRLVTLEGDVMHSGGSMTGGSIQQKTANLLGREREIGELAQQLQEANEQITIAQENIAKLEADRLEEKGRREEAQYQLHQQEIAVARDTERLKSAQSDYDLHLKKYETLQKAAEQLQDSLEQVENELNRIDRLSNLEESNTDDLNAKTETLSLELDKSRRDKEAAQELLTDAMLTLQNAQHEVDRLQRDKKRLAADSQSCEKELASLQTQKDELEKDLASAIAEKEKAEAMVSLCSSDADAAAETVNTLEEKLTAQQKLLREIQANIDDAGQLSSHETERLHRQELALNRLRSEEAQLNERLWTLYELSYQGAVEAEEEYSQRLQPTPAHGVELTGQFVEVEAEADAQRIRDRIREMGTVNVGAVEEYAQLNERFSALNAQKEDIQTAQEDLKELISQLLHQMETVFVGQFTELQGHFSVAFKRLFGGGNGEILLSNPKDPLNCGIDIIVQPPGKKRQLLSLFSGGERALTAIAILFAMLKLKPTPFCILDEIEAALDDANIGYFADYLKEFSEDTQFVVITHRKGTMERCDTLFGVAMEERGVSSMVSVNLTDYDE